MTVLRSGVATDVGRVRSINEDMPLQDSTLFAVADGMGGHAGGEVAARTAIDSLRAGFEHAQSVEGLVEAVHEANQAVWSKGHDDPSLRGMGTTLTAAALVSTDEGDRLVLTNVGDSRAYQLHGQELHQVTVDHSVAEELVARGELSESEAAVHPHRHILTRALGIDTDVDVDVWELVPEQGDRFLLCSDGLSNEVPTEDIGRVLSQTRDPQEAADALVQLANAHGGSDNITAVVVDVMVGEPPTGDGSIGATDAKALVEGAEEAPAVARPHMPTTVEAPPPRRRAQRRLTVRVVLFVLILGGLGYGAFAGIRWYVNNSYYVGLRNGQITVFEGRQGGFLGFNPKVLARSGITLSEVETSDVGSTQVAPKLKAGVEESSRGSAVSYVCNLPFLAPGTPAPKWAPKAKWTRCGSAVASRSADSGLVAGESEVI